MRRHNSRHLVRCPAGCCPASRCPAGRCPAARSARGFTLAEALVSLGILSVLLVGMQSAIMLAGKAMPDANPLSGQVVDGRRAQEMVAADLAYATRIIDNSATDITFEVADRDGDNNPETIRFYWSGANTPLKRVYNGVESVVANGVQDFGLKYVTRPVSKTETVSTEVEEPADKLVASFTAYGGGTSPYMDFAVAPSGGLLTDMKGWAAEYFKLPAAPAGATKLRFTKVEVSLKAYPLSLTDPTVGVFAASGTTAAPLVGGAVGAAAPLSRSGLSNTTYAPVAAVLPPGATTTNLNGGYYVIVKGHDLLTPSAYIGYVTSTSAVKPRDVPHMEWSTNGGSTWQPGSANWHNQDMKFSVYGRYVTGATVTTTTTTHYLTTVGMSLSASKDSQARVDTAVPVLNQPVVSVP